METKSERLAALAEADFVAKGSGKRAAGPWLGVILQIIMQVLENSPNKKRGNRLDWVQRAYIAVVTRRTLGRKEKRSTVMDLSGSIADTIDAANGDTLEKAQAELPAECQPS